MNRNVLLSLVLAIASATAAQVANSTDVVAVVDGQSITAGELKRAVGVSALRLEEQAYQLKRQKLDDMITDRLLAAEAAHRGISVDSLLAAEIDASLKPADETAIHEFYVVNKSQLTGDESALHDQIKAYLQKTGKATRKAVYLDSLRSKAAINIRLTAPDVTRLDVGEGSTPPMGQAQAPVTIVVFEDYLCPFCKRANAITAEIMTTYKDRVRFIHRDFPLDSLHPGTRKAHEAARCAGDQDKFWEYRSILYSEGSSAAIQQLITYARTLHLDVTAFETCLNDGTKAKQVQADLDEGMQLGVDGTPAFFVNGRPFAGAQPLATFAAIIDEEVKRFQASGQKLAQAGTVAKE